MNSQLLRRIKNAEQTADTPEGHRPLKVRFIRPGEEPEPIDERFDYLDVVFVRAEPQEVV